MEEGEESHFAREVRQQAGAIRESLEAARDDWQEIAAAGVRVDRVLIVGSGDSFFLAHAAVPAFEVLAGVAAEGIEAYDFVTVRLEAVDERTMVIGVSASGKAVWTLQGVELAARRGALTVGVTNNADGPLAGAARMVLRTRGGTSYSFPTKTTSTAAAVLAGLAATMGRTRGRLGDGAYGAALDDLGRMLPEAIEGVLEPSLVEPLTAAAADWERRRTLVFVGSGAARAAALIGAAKVHETVRRHALAVNAEEFLHLIGFACGREDGVIVVAPTGSGERERQAAAYAARQGAGVVSLVRGGLAAGWDDGKVIPLPTDGLSPWSGAVAAMAALHVAAERFSGLLGTNPDRPDTVDLDYVLGLLYTAPLEGW